MTILSTYLKIILISYSKMAFELIIREREREIILSYYHLNFHYYLFDLTDLSCQLIFSKTNKFACFGIFDEISKI